MLKRKTENTFDAFRTERTFESNPFIHTYIPNIKSVPQGVDILLAFFKT